MVPASSNQIQIEVSSWQAGLYYVIVSRKQKKNRLTVSYKQLIEYELQINP
jgi:hypothetical protein